jgi:VIT1/CCC1 family predicted Fe2+/Mn2+ transporter
MEQKRTLDFEKDPFKLVTSKALDQKIMEEADIALPLHREDLRDLRRPYDSANPQLPGDSRARIVHEREAQAIIKRFCVAFVGGMALLIPMIIMVLHKDLLTTLLVVSVSVILFAVLIAIYSHQSPVDILTLTAAYAAVLVVFVGSSS